MRVYYDRDADVNLIKTKKVLIVGYGSQGHAHAANLRDSGVKDVHIALRPSSATVKKAEAAGFEVMSPADGAAWADVIMMCAPDELQAEIYNEHIGPNLKDGAAIAFAHGLNIHFSLIEPSAGHRRLHDRAQRARATPCARNTRSGGGVPCLIAVAPGPQRAIRLQDDRRCPTPAAIGGGRAGVIETTFKEECETDLFGEQVVLCGGLTALIHRRFRDPGRGRLCAGDGLFRVPARGQADRRPDVRGRHGQHALLDLQHRGNTATTRADRGIVTDETKRGNEAYPRRNPDRQIHPDWMLENRVGQNQLQGHPPSFRRARDRAGRREAACHDALDRRQQAGRQRKELATDLTVPASCFDKLNMRL